MKHPVRDRFLILLCSLAALAGAAAAIAVCLGKLSVEPFILALQHAALLGPKTKLILVLSAVVLVFFALLLFGIMLPAKRKRSSTFAIQRNENGMVRISLKALETLVQKCLAQHAELKAVTSSLYSDEESVRVDIHINLQTDISMPLAISALQKQIKKYLEACSGVQIQEVRIFVDGMMPATDETANSPYALPMTLLGMEGDALPTAEEEEEAAEEAVCEAAAEEAAAPAQEDAESVTAEETPAVEENAQENAEAEVE